ncbi:vesicle-associated membrane protein [Musa troglodytarum]|uniref:Vesicle-associated membrane protein n=1 Tax=Musa troglodytarum TaxID=320322 RepID=A0A9E7KNF4_9LILI|nr:vesicle-associated membrane protein [Musa troglodytarum]
MKTGVFLPAAHAPDNVRRLMIGRNGRDLFNLPTCQKKANPGWLCLVREEEAAARRDVVSGRSGGRPLGSVTTEIIC